MIIKTNPIIDADVEDRIAISKTIRICKELMSMVTLYTVSDNGWITCADNGEILVTEEELYSIIKILNTMDRIFDEAPSAIDGSGHKELAVEFIG